MLMQPTQRVSHFNRAAVLHQPSWLQGQKFQWMANNQQIAFYPKYPSALIVLMVGRQLLCPDQFFVIFVMTVAGALRLDFVKTQLILRS